MPEYDILCVEDFLHLCAAGLHAAQPGVYPLADVRSPLEFARGHIPGAVNIPLFSDAERAEIGTLYVQVGRQEAIMRGMELAGPKLGHVLKQIFALCRGRTAGEVALYCSKGGMRSASVAWLLQMVGLRPSLLDGGYKAFRRYTLALFEQPLNLLVLGGHTGAGKTRVLHCLADRGAQTVDLEALAKHRGSAFGAISDCPQPTCEQFENQLAVTLNTMRRHLPIWVEDESENLGTVNLPRSFFRQLRSSPLFILESSKECRLDRLLAEYGDLAADYVDNRLDHIKKRLGGLEYKRAKAASAAGNLPALADILLDYYDRAYAKQQARRRPAAVVRTDNPEEAAERLLELGF